MSTEPEQDPLDQLRVVLRSLSPEALARIGVRLDPDPGAWEPVRDCFVEALSNLGRSRAARMLAQYPFAGVHTAYSVGLTRELLSEFQRCWRQDRAA